MTYDDLISWVESKMDKDFTDYRDLGEFRDDVEDVKKNDVIDDGRKKTAIDLIDSWLDDDLYVKKELDYGSIKNIIETNKIEDIKELGPTQARAEYESMKDEGYSEPTLEIVKGIVEGKEVPPIDVGKVVGDYRDIIERARTQEDLGKIVMGEVEREYGREVRERVSMLVAIRGGELETLSEEAFRKTSLEISKTSTKDELYDISRRLTEIPNLTTNLRKELARIIRTRMNELEA